MLTDSVTYLMASTIYFICTYLNDIIGIAPPQTANSASFSFNVITSLGLPINQHKVVQPTEELFCLGITINVRTGVLNMPKDKMSQVKSLCVQWGSLTYTTCKSLQKLLDHLIYVHKCVQPAHLFVNRTLQVLRNSSACGNTTLGVAFHKDINWFCRFMETYNGINKIHVSNDADL